MVVVVVVVAKDAPAHQPFMPTHAHARVMFGVGPAHPESHIYGPGMGRANVYTHTHMEATVTHMGG